MVLQLESEIYQIIEHSYQCYMKHFKSNINRICSCEHSNEPSGCVKGGELD
jgi:hypothetical protein